MTEVVPNSRTGRANRGAKPGERRGGRQKGTPNKLTIAMNEAVAKRIGDGEEFDVLAACWRDGKLAWPLRLKALEVSMQYRYPRLQATEITGKDGNALIPDSTSEFDKARLIAHVLSSAMHGETRH